MTRTSETRDEAGSGQLGDAVVGRLGTDPERIANLFPRHLIPIPNQRHLACASASCAPPPMPLAQVDSAPPPGALGHVPASRKAESSPSGQ